jgi:hypothetical protein
MGLFDFFKKKDATTDTTPPAAGIPGDAASQTGPQQPTDGTMGVPPIPGDTPSSVPGSPSDFSQQVPGAMPGSIPGAADGTSNGNEGPVNPMPGSAENKVIDGIKDFNKPDGQNPTQQ